MKFVYCVDENFNFQLATSIFSLLNNVNREITIYVLHENPDTFNNFKKTFENHNNCSSLELIKVDTSGINFPNIKNAHVTKATYYRIFIPRYIVDYDSLVYLDADTIIMSNPLDMLEMGINELNTKRLEIGACIETTRQKSPDIFKRLDISGDHYFNAGVMIFNKLNDETNQLTENLLEVMNKLGTKIKYWDQDVLNKYFDSKFLSLNPKLNWKIDDKQPRLEANSNPCIVHYAGSSKPWTLEGILFTDSQYFQDNYFEFTKNKFYLLKSNWKLGTFKLLIKHIFNFSIFKNRSFMKIITSTVIMLMKKRNI